MADPKHSPGPWRRVTGDSDYVDGTLVDAKGDAVYFAYGNLQAKYPGPRHEANSRLADAAAEMRELLELYLKRGETVELDERADALLARIDGEVSGG